LQKSFIIFLVYLPLALSSAQSFGDVCGAKPVPYQAEYAVSRKGKAAGSMLVILENTGPDVFIYSMDTRIKWGLVRPKILQRSEFRWQNGSFLPVRFQSTQKLSFYKRSEWVNFNWETGKATGRKKRVDFELDIHPGVQDKLTVYLLLARELCSERSTIDAEIISGPNRSHHSYQLQGKESMDTTLGVLETIHIRRGRADGERQTDLWHAGEIGFLPVKLVYRDKKDVTTMRLKSITFSKHSVRSDRITRKQSNG